MNEKTRPIGTVIATALLVMLAGLIGLSISAGSAVSTAQPVEPVGNPNHLERTGDQVTANPISILELHADDNYISQTVAITGEYVAWDLYFLTTAYAEFEGNEAPEPHSYVILQDQLPDPAYDGWTLIVTGTVGRYFHDYAYLGETEGRRLIVSDWQALSPPSVGHTPPAPKTVSPAPPPGPAQAANPAETDCECKWAFIVSGGIRDAANKQRYRNDIDEKWKYKTEAADYPDECVDVFYYDGDGNDLPNVPNGQVEQASKAKIEARLQELAPKMQECKEKGIKPTLQFLVTDHGSGYHNANQRADTNKRGIRGHTKVDEDGDEGGDVDAIAESNLRLDAKNLAEGRMSRRNLYQGDGGQNPDTVVHNDGGTIKVWRCTSPPCAGPPPLADPPWKLVGQDTNGDKVIDSTDGGIDLDGDGDTTETVSFDEAINLVGDEVLTDDELTNMFRPLCPSGVDLYVEMAQCYGGGFKEDLDRLRSAGCHVHFAAAASEGEVSWGNAEKDYFEHNFIAKITDLISDTQKPVTPDVWQDAYDDASEKVDSKKYNTHPVSDVDCLIMVGPYIKGDQICIKVINYCKQDVTANLYLGTYNFGIAASALDQHTETVTLVAGESREWCWPLPTDPGTYCFLGHASTTEPRYEFHPRWLNDQKIEAAGSNEPEEQTFRVGPDDSMPVAVYLDPNPYLPPGWEYSLSHEWIWLGDGPVTATMTITPAPGSTGLGRLWVYGWALEEGGTLPETTAFTPTNEFAYLGYVYLDLDTTPMRFLYLPIAIKGY